MERIVQLLDDLDDLISMIGLVRESKTLLDRDKRFDMPGFRPSEHYVRNMKTYGVLPKSLNPKSAFSPVWEKGT